MRIGIVIVGVVLIVIGAALSFVPLVPQASQTVTYSTPYEANITGFSLTGSVPVSVSWSSSTSAEVAISTCSAVSGVNCTGSVNVVIQNGTSGSWSGNVNTGGAIAVAVGTTGASVTVHFTLAEVTIGLIILVVGILLLIVGVILKKKGVEAPAPSPPPTPASPPPQ